MKERNFGYLIIIALGFMLSACEKQETVLVIDAELQPIIDMFIEEAKTRGKDIQLNEFNLTATIEPINRESVAGQCTQGEGTISQILIDQQFWSGYTPLAKESLVFHELGHCILQRSHRDDKDLEGNCLSLMESGRGFCQMIYTATTRDQYLDELFSE